MTKRRGIDFSFGEGGRILPEFTFPRFFFLSSWRQALLRAARRESESNGRRAPVRIDDLAAGGKPDALLFHVRECPLEITAPQRLSGNHRVQRNAEHARLLRAVGVQRVELIDE